MLEPGHFNLFSPKWIGPIFVGTGLFALVTQAFAWIYLGRLHSLLLGGGLGLLMVGAIAWFFYLDDRRSGARFSDTKELPSADEYETFLDRCVEPDDEPDRDGI